MYYDRIPHWVEGYRFKNIICSFVCLHRFGYSVVTFMTQRTKIVLIQCYVYVIDIVGGEFPDVVYLCRYSVAVWFCADIIVTLKDVLPLPSPLPAVVERTSKVLCHYPPNKKDRRLPVVLWVFRMVVT